MTTRKTSVSLTSEAISAATSAARQAGMSVSAWLSTAAVEHAWREQALRSADEMYAEAVATHGPLSAEQQREIAEILLVTTGSGADAMHVSRGDEVAGSHAA